MHIVLGGTGHVGSVAAETLLAAGEPVTLVGRDASAVAAFRDERPGQKGAEVAGVDVHDVEALRALFRTGRRAFLLNPPADPSTDTDAEETATVAAILEALDGSGLQKVVAASTMGAVAGEALQPRTGDSSILYDFEKGLAAQPIPAAIDRAAYYFSNFDLQLDAIRETGEFQTIFPADFALPMVAPADLGVVAARRMMSGLDDVGVVSIEGPTRPTFGEVAQVFAEVIGREVRTVVTPRERWIEVFRAQGFSVPAADAYARMTAVAIDGPETPEGETEKGPTTLEAYVRTLVRGG
jgi:uncharacterized protein YbjT (DUF2867 family)